MTDHPGIEPSAREIADTARLLRLAATTLLATGFMLLVAGGLALYYMGVQGLSFMPMILLVALAEFVVGIFLRRRAGEMMGALKIKDENQ